MAWRVACKRLSVSVPLRVPGRWQGGFEWDPSEDQQTEARIGPNHTGH